jgi:hypothetical protein
MMDNSETAKSREVRVKVQWFVDGKYVYQKEMLPRSLSDGDSYELTYKATVVYDPEGLIYHDDDSGETTTTYLDKEEV